MCVYVVGRRIVFIFFVNNPKFCIERIKQQQLNVDDDVQEKEKKKLSKIAPNISNNIDIIRSETSKNDEFFFYFFSQELE